MYVVRSEVVLTWKVVYVQLGFHLDKCSFTEHFLCIPGWDKMVRYVIEWLLHQLGIFELHDSQVEVRECVRRVERAQGNRSLVC